MRPKTRRNVVNFVLCGITQVEECRESFKKDCHIEYMAVPKAQKMEVCQNPLKRDCDVQGNITCSMETETVCETM